MSSILQHFQVQLSFKIEKMNLMRFDYLLKRKHLFDFDVFLPTIRNKETGKLGVNLQRELVWSLFQKQQLIYSIFKGIYIPPIVIIDRSYLEGGGVYQVIDGKQRLNAMIGFLDNEFTIEVCGKVYFYKDLDRQAQSHLNSFYPDFHIGFENQDNPISDKEKLVWCKTVNYGTPMVSNFFDRFDV